MKLLVCLVSLFVFASCSTMSGSMSEKKSCCKKTKEAKCKDKKSCDLKEKKACCKKK